MIAIIPNTSWNHFENTPSAVLKNQASRPGKTCKLVLQQLCQLLFLTLASFLTVSLSEEGEKKDLQGDFGIYIKFHVWKNILSCYS